MGTRRAARERALQALYQDAMMGATTAVEAGLWPPEESEDDAAAGAFARELVTGVRAECAHIDELLRAALEHWELERLSRVDLSVLRLGAYELLARPEIPCPVAINEAVEIARRYGSGESSAFVNGVLDRVARTLGRKQDGEERS